MALTHPQHVWKEVWITPEANGQRPFFVITSYSIHYTKLYDGGVVPRQYIPAVDKGIHESMGHGILAGFPVQDFRIILFDGSHHSVDSSEMAFKIAGSMAFKKACEGANPRITSYNVCYTKLLRS